MKDTHKVSQSEAIVGHHTLYLLELCQMGGIQSLIPEYPVNGEILDWSELFLRDEQMVWHVDEECFMAKCNTCTVSYMV